MRQGFSLKIADHLATLDRRAFLKQVTLGVVHMTALSALGKGIQDDPANTAAMPVIFVGHGNPMNAVEDNAFSRAWLALGKALPRPSAILCVSAHWETDGTRVTAMPRPRTIHDFWGFPQELYKKQYPAPGSPEWAERTRKLLRGARVEPDTEWGLDHGTWAPLCRMFPGADVPVFQLSLDRTQPARYHYDLGRELAPLRRSGLLIVGSGNMVHNLGLMEWTDKPFAWATAFDARLKDLIVRRDHEALIRYDALGPEAKLAIPTNEHYLPLLYALALQGQNEPIRFFTEDVSLGSISMRGFQIG
jgi:4,5-DOPA dioxygenase extradiol